MNYTHKYAMQLNEEIVSHEDTYNIILDSQKLYVLRFDGVKMTKNFLGNPDSRTPFFKTMKETLQCFMENNLNNTLTYAECTDLVLSIIFYDTWDGKLPEVLTSDSLSSMIGGLLAKDDSNSSNSN